MSAPYAPLHDVPPVGAIPLEALSHENSESASRKSADGPDDPDGDDSTASLLSELDDLEKTGLDGRPTGSASDQAAAEIVRKVVPETDDPTLPTLTIRVIVCGSLLAVVGAAVSQLLFFKSNAPSLGSFFVILVSLPMGRAMAAYLPSRMIRLPFGLEVDLNPGPFGMKEHLLLTILASSVRRCPRSRTPERREQGTSVAYGADVIAIQGGSPPLL